MHQVTPVITNGKINETLLIQANQLAHLVFDPEIPQGNHERIDQNMRLDNWRDKLQITHANILCITEANLSAPTEQAPATGDNDKPKTLTTDRPESSETPSPKKDMTQRVLAISFNYPRVRDGLESYHIFIAAVHPSARGLRLFSRLLKATKEDARAAGYKTLTISTFPDRFHTMYGLLSREGSGWEVISWERVRWEGETGEGNRKVTMKMALV